MTNIYNFVSVKKRWKFLDRINEQLQQRNLEIVEVIGNVATLKLVFGPDYDGSDMLSLLVPYYPDVNIFFVSCFGSSHRFHSLSEAFDEIEKLLAWKHII